MGDQPWKHSRRPWLLLPQNPSVAKSFTRKGRVPINHSLAHDQLCSPSAGSQGCYRAQVSPQGCKLHLSHLGKALNTVSLLSSHLQRESKWLKWPHRASVGVWNNRKHFTHSWGGVDSAGDGTLREQALSHLREVQWSSGRSFLLLWLGAGYGQSLKRCVWLLG